MDADDVPTEDAVAESAQPSAVGGGDESEAARRVDDGGPTVVAAAAAAAAAVSPTNEGDNLVWLG